jgi:isoquinoline 1-oxidoreductase subunit beta
MNAITKINRRSFILATVAAGGGLAIGLDLPFGGANVAHAADGTPEINAWVVIRPDDTVVIRIARAEMGQGSQTGLAQLVAEELDCDWSKVTTEIPTPGQNVARASASGGISTPPAAVPSASRRTTSARAARPRANCCCRPRPTRGACRLVS